VKFLVECIEIAHDRSGYDRNSHYGIELIGGRYEGKSNYEILAVEQVIRKMRSGDKFVTRAKNAPEAEIEEVTGEHGPYLRTKADDSEEDNLLRLGPCGGLQSVIDLEGIRKRTGLKK
jgi:hypothetical protein